MERWTKGATDEDLGLVAEFHGAQEGWRTSVLDLRLALCDRAVLFVRRGRGAVEVVAGVAPWGMEGFVGSVVVARACRRKGEGERIIREVLRFAKQLG